MKKWIYQLSLSVLVLTAGACGGFSNRGTVDRPMIGAANTTNLSVESVMLTDTSTVLNCVVRFRSGWWVRVDPGSAIIAEEKSYPLTSAHGLEVGEHVWMPDSGVIHFSLIFPPIPSDASSIDFTEGSSDSWRLWGIDLTGKARHDMNLDAVPDRLLLPSDAKIPESIISSSDAATIRLHILGYRPSMGDKLLWVASTLHGTVGSDAPARVNGDGIAEVRLPISTPAQFFWVQLDKLTSIGGCVMVAPGETINVYVDTHSSGRKNMRIRNGEPSAAAPDGKEFPAFYADGTYSAIHQMIGDFAVNVFSGEVGDPDMDGDAFTAYITGKYRELMDSVERDDRLNEQQKRYARGVISGDLLFLADDPNYVLLHVRAVTVGDSTEDLNSLFGVEPMKLSHENLREIASLIDFSDMDMLWSENLAGGVVDAGSIAKWEDAGVDPVILKMLRLYRKAYKKADSGALEPALADSLRAQCAPMADEVAAHDAAVKARRKAILEELAR
ncbi:MAG: hypothetical protein K2M04_07750 [Muribaculaceae bacterium]|nr:hypothetical protein [Muribaculaceae bacterium]